MQDTTYSEYGEDETGWQFRPKPEAAADPAGEAGWFLQRERERRGISLETAALATRISQRYLQAIELGALSLLPGREDALRYIRSYGDFLGFEPGPLAAHYGGLLPQGAAGPAPRDKPQGATILRFPGFAGAPGSSARVMLSTAVAVFLFGGAAWLMAPDGATAPEPPLAGPAALPQVQATYPAADTFPDPAPAAAADPLATASAEPPPARPVEESLPAPAVPDPRIRISETPLGDDRRRARVAKAQDRIPAGESTGSAAEDGGRTNLTDFIRQRVGTTAAAPPPSGEPKASGARVYGVENGDARVVLRAIAPVWVRVEDRQGNVLLTQTFLAGDSYRVPNRDGLLLIARDGGALRYSIDGTDRGSLGTPGEILVGRSLDLKKLGKADG